MKKILSSVTENLPKPMSLHSRAYPNLALTLAFVTSLMSACAYPPDLDLTSDCVEGEVITAAASCVYETPASEGWVWVQCSGLDRTVLAESQIQKSEPGDRILVVWAVCNDGRSAVAAADAGVVLGVGQVFSFNTKLLTGSETTQPRP